MQRCELRLTRGNFQVPVIAVFTKHDQFRREVRMKLEDQGGGEVSRALLDRKMKEIFNRHYLAKLGKAPWFVCLASKNFTNQLACNTLIVFPAEMDKPGERCTPLLEKTADALSGNIVSLMLLSVQKDNLELNIRQAVKW
jgi:hypothetical protein